MYGPTIRTVLDMGGQDCKAIRCDQRGKVTAFLMNDKCAAGTGRGMEVFADLLQVHINDVGQMSIVDDEPEPVSSTCVVFAKSEAVGLLRKGWSKDRVLAAYCAGFADFVGPDKVLMYCGRDIGATIRNLRQLLRSGRCCTGSLRG